MSRRDSLEHDTFQNDQIIGDLADRAELRYLRLRCLEMAIRCAPPDDAVPELLIEDAANALLRFILTGTMAQQAGVGGKPETP